MNNNETPPPPLFFHGFFHALSQTYRVEDLYSLPLTNYLRQVAICA